ncbi:Exportin-4 [Dinochytrium kinnereticum]|nr:Exportin-4 [Dinochytrium kinnereticum]
MKCSSSWISTFMSTKSFDADDDFADELLTISKTIERALSSFPTRILPRCESLVAFLDEVARLTLICLQYLKEDEMVQLETGTVDALELLLGAWATIALDLVEGDYDLSSPLTALIKSHGFPIFQLFLESKLILAERDADFEAEESIDERDDSILYGDQLVYMGILGRLNPESSLEHIQTLLVDRITRLQEFFHSGVDFEETNFQAQYREGLYEHIHWLVLFSGYVLCDAGAGETPLIPRRLLQLSNSANGKGKDLLVEIPSIIFKLWSLVTVEPKSSLFFLCSPLLAETILWFTQRWARTYLFVSSSEYSGQLSSSLLQAFSETGNGPHVLDFILEALVKTFLMWDSEEKVLTAVSNLIDTLACQSALRRQFLQSSALSSLLNAFFGGLNRIPTSLHSTLVRTLAGLVSYSEHENAQKAFFTGLFELLKRELANVVGRSDLRTVYQDPVVKVAVLNTLDLYEGLALAANKVNGNLLIPAIKEDIGLLSNIVDLYRNSPDVFVAFIRLQLAFSKLLTFTESYASEMKALCSVEQLSQDLNFFVDSLYIVMQEDIDDTMFNDFLFTSLGFILPVIDAQLLQVLALKHSLLREFVNGLLDGILEHVMDCLFFRELELEIIESIGEAFFSLILARQLKYQSLIQSLLIKQDSRFQERLSNAFGELNNSIDRASRALQSGSNCRDDVPLVDSRTFRVFLDSFRGFLMNVRGFLRVL